MWCGYCNSASFQLHRTWDVWGLRKSTYPEMSWALALVLDNSRHSLGTCGNPQKESLLPDTVVLIICMILPPLWFSLCPLPLSVSPFPPAPPVPHPWPGPVCFLFSLLWVLPDASWYFLSLSYNKNLSPNGVSSFFFVPRAGGVISESTLQAHLWGFGEPLAMPVGG